MTSNEGLFDKLRATQFPQLNEGAVYADWTGSALPPVSLIDAHHDSLRSTLLENPHSHHAPSTMAMEQVREARSAVLRYFRASPDEYEVIFTQNATAAILLLQHYLFEGGELLLTTDNHNSVNGLREIARRGGAVARYAPLKKDLTFDSVVLRRMLEYPRSATGHKLFAFPAKSNYSGIKHPLDWVRKAKELGWDVLLDAAAYASNDRLDLSEVKPDFVPISFYKLFGYPTGVGCLIIRKEMYGKMHKRWFSGGSILLVSVMKDFFAPEVLGYARYEDGTVNFGQIPAITRGLTFLEGLGDIKGHATGLGTRLHDELTSMGRVGKNVLIHSPRGSDIVTFSIIKGGKIVNAWLFEQAANAENVYVRTGCFCNPGVNETVFGYSVDTFVALHNDALHPEQITIDALKDRLGETPVGAIRASFGYANNSDDVARLAAVVNKFLHN